MVVSSASNQNKPQKVLVTPRLFTSQHHAKMNPDQEIVLDTDNSMSLFRPPILRSASAILDRALFSKIIPITAARVHNLKHIGKYRDAFGATKELLVKERLRNVREDPEKSIADRGGKCMLLCPEVKALGMYYTIRLTF